MKKKKKKARETLIYRKQTRGSKTKSGKQRRPVRWGHVGPDAHGRTVRKVGDENSVCPGQPHLSFSLPHHSSTCSVKNISHIKHRERNIYKVYKV